MIKNKKKSRTARTAKPARGRSKRMAAARKDLQRMQEEIAPFIRQRRIERVSTAGKWCDTSSLVSDLCAFPTKVLPRR